VIAVLPADPFIGDDREYERLLGAAIAEGRETITTIGITPTHAETGFGYIRTATNLGARAHGAVVHDVGAFVEKPNRETAEQYVASKQYLWNSGMFFLTARRMFEETRRHLPALADILEAAVAAPSDAAAAAVVRDRYGAAPNISIDNGIMEKASGLRVLPGSFGWNDVGSWAAVATINRTDAQGNVVLGDATKAALQAVVIDGKNNLVIADEGAPFVGVVGVEGLVVVATKDAILVVPRELAQDVKKVVEAAKNAGRGDLL
jgi:mannose-1-phosphate guanylyltransferase